MKKLLPLIAVFVCFWANVPVCAQDSGRPVVAGRVTDSNGEPLAGANVYVRGDIKNGTSPVPWPIQGRRRLILFLKTIRI